jgi:hypothetical protein
MPRRFVKQGLNYGKQRVESDRFNESKLSCSFGSSVNMDIMVSDGELRGTASALASLLHVAECSL